MQLVQVAVTSRGEVGEYRSFKRQVDELVGRINGRFGDPDWVPVRYLYRSYAVVGRVIKGMDVVGQIVKGDRIRSAVVMSPRR